MAASALASLDSRAQARVFEIFVRRREQLARYARAFHTRFTPEDVEELLSDTSEAVLRIGRLPPELVQLLLDGSDGGEERMFCYVRQILRNLALRRVAAMLRARADGPADGPGDGPGDGPADGQGDVRAVGPAELGDSGAQARACLTRLDGGDVTVEMLWARLEAALSPTHLEVIRRVLDGATWTDAATKVAEEYGQRAETLRLLTLRRLRRVGDAWREERERSGPTSRRAVRSVPTATHGRAERASGNEPSRNNTRPVTPDSEP